MTSDTKKSTNERLKNITKLPIFNHLLHLNNIEFNNLKNQFVGILFYQFYFLSLKKLLFLDWQAKSWNIQHILIK